ncbi:hypothetical protein [Streptomyces avicenniae]|uniref:hypothetical protein n=1 Tax=Streptomyces avicenniae TaxID=500153 RepID=UPI00069939BA|nr:hypothetical protein [Streptomyces avicenniae]
MHAVRLTTADAAATVTSHTASVTDWCARYVRPWWSAETVPAEEPTAAPLLVAEVDPGRYASLAAEVSGADHATVAYARTPLLVAREHAERVVTAVSPATALAYRAQTHAARLSIFGTDPGEVATAAARLVREAVRGVLLRDGWTVLHASAVERDGQVVLSFGGKGAGKTTTALTLATHGWRLLANDRVFVRPDDAGGVTVLPWPSAAALGLGLLNVFGWSDTVRHRLEAGEALHPTQDPQVTDALLAGRREPLWQGKRELKAQVFPDQFPTWLGIHLASTGRAAHLLFPQVTPDAVPTVRQHSRTVHDHDFMTGATEDRYPDVFGLAGGVDGGGHATSRETVTALLTRLPRHAVTLGHDLAANADLLRRLTS